MPRTVVWSRKGRQTNTLNQVMKRCSPSSHEHNAPIWSGLEDLSRLGPYKKSCPHFSFQKRRMRQLPSTRSSSWSYVIGLLLPPPPPSTPTPPALPPLLQSSSCFWGPHRTHGACSPPPQDTLGLVELSYQLDLFSAAPLKHPNLSPARYKAHRRPPQRTQLGARHQHLWSWADPAMST